MIATAKRFTLKDYHRLIEIGFFGAADRVELIRGQIVDMAAKGKRHSVCSTRLNRELILLLGDRATLRGQEPITLPNDSEPEPDFAIVQNRDDEYLISHPHPADVQLVIEISDSSLAYDQEVKLPLYAEAGIANCWIFNLPESCLETHSDPYQKLQGEFGYRTKRIYLPGETIALPCFSDLLLNLTGIFIET